MENILNHLLTLKYSSAKPKINWKVTQIIIRLKKTTLLLLTYNSVKPPKSILLYFVNIIKTL